MCEDMNPQIFHVWLDTNNQEKCIAENVSTNNWEEPIECVFQSRDDIQFKLHWDCHYLTTQTNDVTQQNQKKNKNKNKGYIPKTTKVSLQCKVPYLLSRFECSNIVITCQQIPKLRFHRYYDPNYGAQFKGSETHNINLQFNRRTVNSIWGQINQNLTFFMELRGYSCERIPSLVSFFFLVLFCTSRVHFANSQVSSAENKK